MTHPKAKAWPKSICAGSWRRPPGAGPNEEAIVCLLGLNGLRVSEVSAAQVDGSPARSRRPLAAGARPGGKEVSVPLNTRTERAVLAAAGDRSSGPIVRRPADRRRQAGTVAPLRPYNRQAVYERLVEIGQTAGLIGSEADKVDKLHPHVLRHSFVTLLLDAGAKRRQDPSPSPCCPSETARSVPPRR